MTKLNFQNPHTSDPAAGSAGGSAWREARRLRQLANGRRWRMWGRHAEVDQWARQSRAERAVARLLERELASARILHDRRLGVRQIDHLVVAASGIYLVETRWFAPPLTWHHDALWSGPVRLNDYLVDIVDLGHSVRSRLATELNESVTLTTVLAVHGTPLPPGLLGTESLLMFNSPDLPGYIRTRMPRLTPLDVTIRADAAEGCLRAA